MLNSILLSLFISISTPVEQSDNFNQHEIITKESNIEITTSLSVKSSKIRSSIPNELNVIKTGTRRGGIKI